MYYGLCYSIAEMSPALPHTGGAYSFARSAMGPWGGFLTGLAENVEYVITTAVVGGAIALLDAVDHRGSVQHHRRSVVEQRAVLVGGRSTSCSSRSTSAASRPRSASPSASRSSRWAILIVFYIAALVSGKFSSDLWFNIADGGGAAPAGDGTVPPVRDQRHLQGPAVRDLVLPRDRGGAARGRGVDGSPARRAQGHDPGHAHAAAPQHRRPVPQHRAWAAARSRSANPAPRCSTASRRSSATDTGAVLLGMMGLVGLIASFFTIMYAYGRNTYSLSRAGYFPKFLSVTHKTRKTPHVALIAGAIVGLRRAVGRLVPRQAGRRHRGAGRRARS